MNVNMIVNMLLRMLMRRGLSRTIRRGMGRMRRDPGRPRSPRRQSRRSNQD